MTASGGDEAGARIARGPLDLGALLAETDDPGCGALVIFGGMIRDHNLGDEVIAIEYDVHLPTAERAIQQIEGEARERFGVRHCRICHRVGRVDLGEASVWIVVRAGHRPAAYEASRWAIDALKQRVPIWKLEVLARGASRYLDGHPIRPAGERDA